MSILRCEDISFGYDDGLILDKVSLSLECGECIIITGPSGCGKSTLCNILSGIIPRSIEGSFEGEVYLLDGSLKTMSLENIVKNLGIVFQNPDSQLFSPTVEDELAFGPENLCLSVDEIENRITKVLRAVNMEEYRYSNPFELSGGQKQLIALAAVLVLEPKVLIFDEALSQLDDEATQRIITIINNLKKDGCGIIMIEHDDENFSIGDKVFNLKNGTLEVLYNG